MDTVEDQDEALRLQRANGLQQQLEGVAHCHGERMHRVRQTASSRGITFSRLLQFSAE